MVKSLLIKKCGSYFESWEESILEEIFSDIDIERKRKYFLISVAKEYVNKLSGGKKLTCLSTEFYTIRGHSNDFANKKISEIQSKNNEKLRVKRNESPEKYKFDSPMNVQFWTKRGFSEEDANKKIRSFSPVRVEYWIERGFTEDESKIEVSKFQQNMSNRFCEKLKDFPKNYVGRLPNQVEYWQKRGFSEEESRNKVSERQRTFSLQKCIEKYGKKEGQKKFEDRQRKWIKSFHQSLDEQGDGRSKQSKWANEIIDRICESLGIEKPNKEKWISSKDRELKFAYDFTLGKKIIEFNGDLWHANPSIYDEDFIIPICNLTSLEKQKKDRIKIELAESNGYEVLVIWEKDYKETPEIVINQCLSYLRG